MNKITVVTVCLNAEKHIEETMRSVLEQTWQQLEYIIIDGASTDGTMSIIRSIALEYPKRDIVITSEPDTGIYNAMNKGIAKATGEWINFLNAGDTFVSQEILAKFFDTGIDTKTDVLYGDNYLISSVGKYLCQRDDTPCFYLNCPFCHQAAFVRTSLMKEYLFDENYKIAADYNFFLCLFRAGGNFIHKNICAVNYLDGGISSKFTRKMLDEQERAFGSYGSINYLSRKIVWMIKQDIKSIMPPVIKIYQKKKSLSKSLIFIE